MRRERARADRVGWRRGSRAIVLGILLGSFAAGAEAIGQTVDAPPPSSSAVEGDALTVATTELKQGKYSAAMARFRTLLQQNPGEEKAQVGLLRGLLETGGYAEAERRLIRHYAPPLNEQHNPLATLLAR